MEDVPYAKMGIVSTMGCAILLVLRAGLSFFGATASTIIQITKTSLSVQQAKLQNWKYFQ